MIITVNRRLKYVVWDSIGGDQWWPLIGRTIQGNVTILINFTSVKFYTLTLIAVVNNFSPLFTTILAWILLGERFGVSLIVKLLIAFGGALLIILYDKDESVVKEGSSTVGFIALVLNPIFVAIGTVMMRQMRKLNESVVSCYMNATTVIVFGPAIYAMGEDLSPCLSFSVWDWCWIIGLSISVVGSQTFRYKAV